MEVLLKMHLFNPVEMNKQNPTKKPNQRNSHKLQPQIHASGLASSSLPSENILKKKKKRSRDSSLIL